MEKKEPVIPALFFVPELVITKKSLLVFFQQVVETVYIIFLIDQLV